MIKRHFYVCESVSVCVAKKRKERHKDGIKKKRKKKKERKKENGQYRTY